MRKNSKTVIDRWKKRRPYRSFRSIWTDGTTIYSYDTAIATITEDGRIILNARHYSRTTADKQRAIALSVDEIAGIVTDVWWGATGPDLVRAAKGRRVEYRMAA